MTWLHALEGPKVTFRWMMSRTEEGITYASLENAIFEEKYDMSTLGAKLASALAFAAPHDFQQTLHARKQEAFRSGKTVTGQQLLYLVDRHFRMTEADGAIYDRDHISSVSARNNNLAEFLTLWDRVLSGLQVVPDTKMLEALFLEQARKCKNMES